MKKLVVLFISLMFMVSVFVNAKASNVYADDIINLEYEPTDSQLVYAALGDSMSQGYMFEGYKDENSGWENVLEGTYIDKFAKDINAKLVDLTIHGLQPDELYYLLAPEAYERQGNKTQTAADHFNTWNGRFGGIENMSEYYQDAIKDADVITYDIGINYFGTFLTDMGSINGLFTDLLLGNKCKTQIKNICDKITQELEKIIPNIGIPIIGEDGIINRILYGCVSYMVYGDKCIAEIKKLNPTVQIIMIPLSNPQRELYLDLNGIKISFSDILDIMFESLNNYFRYISPNRGLYTIAELSSPMISFGDELYFYPDDPSPDVEKNFCDMVKEFYHDATETALGKGNGKTYEAHDDTELINMFKKAATYRTFTIDIIKEFAGGLLSGNDETKAALAEDLIGIFTATNLMELSDEDYSKISLIMHFGDIGARGFQTHPCPRGLDVKYDAVKKVYKPIDKNNEYEEIETKLNEDGLYTLYMNSNNAGEYTFTRVGSTDDCKWTIKDNNDKYLSIDKDSLVNNNQASIWEYKDGYLFTKEVSTKSILPIKKTYYLTYKYGELTVTTLKYIATKVVLTKKVLDHTHTPGEEKIENEVEATCISKGYYDIVKYCTECGKELTRIHNIVGIDPDGHKFGEENIETIDGKMYLVTRCEYCGKEDIDKRKEFPSQDYEVNVTVDEKTRRILFFFTKKYYDINISVLEEASKIEYSFDGDNWKIGTSCTTSTKPKKLYVRITDSEGMFQYYSYDEGTIIPGN